MNNPADTVELRASTSYGIPEHEALFVFNGDDDAERFVNWWYLEGKKHFKTWCIREGIDPND